MTVILPNCLTELVLADTRVPCFESLHVHNHIVFPSRILAKTAQMTIPTVLKKEN